MLISTHVLVGAAIGRALSRVPAGRPGSTVPRAGASAAELAAAVTIGVASHFACDSLPHWGAGIENGDVREPAFLRVAVPDGLAGLSLLTALTLGERGRRRVLVAACALGACLPDADKVGALFLGRSPYPGWVDRWHGSIQRESPKLLTSDIAIIAVFAAVLLKGMFHEVRGEARSARQDRHRLRGSR